MTSVKRLKLDTLLLSAFPTPVGETREKNVALTKQLEVLVAKEAQLDRDQAAVDL